MASALALRVDQQTFEDNQVKISFQVLFFDSTLGIQEEKQVNVKFAAGSTVQQIENAVEAAIIDQAKVFWPTMVLGLTDIIMMDIKRGN